MEGNPLHPINQGSLCARGQASLQGLYNPDRLQGPMKKNAQGRFEPISWEEAERLLLEKLSQLSKEGKGERIAFISELITGTQKDLAARWMEELGANAFSLWEPFAGEYLRKANQISFGLDLIPAYRLDRADFLISFGADFLETWLSNVEFTRQFADFHAVGKSGKKPFVYVGPRLSLTGVNADRWVCVPPGAEPLVLIAMVKILLDEDPNLVGKEGIRAFRSLLRDFSLEAIQASTGVKIQTLRRLSRRLFQGLESSSPGRVGRINPDRNGGCREPALGSIKGGTRETIAFDDPSALSGAARAADMKELAEKMRKGAVDLLFLSNSNPVYSLPPAWEFDQALKAVPLIVSFSHTLDETSRMAHLLLPTHSPLSPGGTIDPERACGDSCSLSWAPFSTPGISATSSSRPGKNYMGRKNFRGIIFITFSRKVGEALPGWKPSKEGAPGKFRKRQPLRFLCGSRTFLFPVPRWPTRVKRIFISFPILRCSFSMGAGSNRPWLQELPDPITQTTWGSWVEIHPDTARRMGIAKGDLVRLRSPRRIFGGSGFPLLRDAPRNPRHTHGAGARRVRALCLRPGSQRQSPPRPPDGNSFRGADPDAFESEDRKRRRAGPHSPTRTGVLTNTGGGSFRPFP